MTTTAWRRLLLALCAFGLLQSGFETWTELSRMAFIPGFAAGGYAGYGSADERPTKTPFIDRLTIAPGSEAYREGLRTGDLLDLRALSPSERYRWRAQWWWIGERADLTILRGNGTLHLPLQAKHYPATTDMWISLAGGYWMLLFAGLISWLRPERRETRVLALLLILLEIGQNFQPQNWITPWPALDAALAALSGIPYYAGIALLATYAMLFALPASPLRKLLAGASYVSAAIAALYGLVACAGTWTARAELTMPFTGYGPITHFLTIGVPALFPLLCLVASIASTRGVERTRISWPGIPLALIYCCNVAAVPPINLSNDTARELVSAWNVSAFLAPLGLTYALLNHRLLDIGFAINRAAVFTTVSLIVVGIFVLVEWALAQWFSAASHATNLAISAALALTLGLSVRTIHSRVDRVLDTLFFRKRHEDEQAIRTLAREVAYVTDAGVLLARVKAVLEDHADATGVEILLDDGAGLYGDVGENDPAIVRLRATHTILDLHGVETTIRGEFAYPMVARGRLVGVLVLGLKRSGETYAPDESDAIAQLAHDAAVALDVLITKKPASGDGMLEEILLSTRAMYSAIQNLPAAIAEANRAAVGETSPRPPQQIS